MKTKYLIAKVALVTAFLVIIPNISFAETSSVQMSFQQKIRSEFGTIKNFFFKIYPFKKQEVKKEVGNPSTPSVPESVNNTNKASTKKDETGPTSNKSLTPSTNTGNVKVALGTTGQSAPRNTPTEPTTPIQSTYSLNLSDTSGGSIVSDSIKIGCEANSVCSFTLPAGTKVKLTAVSNDGYVFLGWSGDACEQERVCSITLNKNINVKAIFKTNVTPKIQGTITFPGRTATCYIPLGKDYCTQLLSWEIKNPQDVHLSDNGTEYYIKSDGSTDIIKDLRFKLTHGPHEIALKNHGDTLDSITINVECVAGTVYQSDECKAKESFKLYIFKPISGAVESNPEGINCGEDINDCNIGFLPSTKVTLTFIPRPGDSFPGWTGDCTGTNTVCNIIMDRAHSVGVSTR